jgi:AraC-like DNA-binding protein
MSTLKTEKPVFENYGMDTGITDIHNIRMSYTHTHPEIEVNLLVQGSAKYIFKGKILNIPQQRLTAFWATTPHCMIEASDDVRFLVADVPLDIFLQWQLPEPFVHALLKGEVITAPDRASLQSDFCMIMRWASINYRNNPVHRRIFLLEAEARLLRLALNYTQAAHPASLTSGSKSAEKVAHILEFISRKHQEQITLADIASAAGVHPNYAIPLFKKYCGTSIQKYLTQIRLSHAERDLLISSDTVTTIAFNAGFNSLSQFYAEFERKHAMSPGNYRKKMLLAKK